MPEDGDDDDERDEERVAKYILMIFERGAVRDRYLIPKHLSY